MQPRKRWKTLESRQSLEALCHLGGTLKEETAEARTLKRAENKSSPCDDVQTWTGCQGRWGRIQADVQAG